LAYGENLEIGEDIIVYGSESLSCAISSIAGILDMTIRVGKINPPTSDDNVVVAAREIAIFDSSRITVNS